MLKYKKISGRNLFHFPLFLKEIGTIHHGRPPYSWDQFCVFGKSTKSNSIHKERISGTTEISQRLHQWLSKWSSRSPDRAGYIPFPAGRGLKELPCGWCDVSILISLNPPHSHHHCKVCVHPQFLKKPFLFQSSYNISNKTKRGYEM